MDFLPTDRYQVLYSKTAMVDPDVAPAGWWVGGGGVDASVPAGA
jgi:hypothetical protein